ncbi:putative tail fiber protein H [Vibrio phage 393E50-1]|nr:putative tail fiber protein H [Vibrio phage 393E50-1]
MSNNMRKLVNFPVGLRTTVTATLGDDIPNLSQVQSIAQGLANVKEAVAVDVDVNVDLVTGGLLTLDSYTLQEGDRVLAYTQTDPVENGIYIASSGSWVRSTDADEQSELAPLTQVSVLNGGHAGRVYKLTNPTAPAVDVDAQTWVVTSASSSAALDVSVDDGNFGVIAGTNAQSVLDSVDDQIITTNLNVDTLDTRVDNLSGVTGSDLETFTGSTIQDGASVKVALQDLETAHEAFVADIADDRFESTQTTLTQGNAITFTHSIGTKRLSGIKVYDTADEDITHTVIITLVDADSITVQNDDVDVDVFVVCAK